MHLAGKDAAATAYYIVFMGLIWGIVVIPAALVGKLFKTRKVYSGSMQVVRGGALAAIALLTFAVVNASQQQKEPHTLQTTFKELQGRNEAKRQNLLRELIDTRRPNP
jgi:hypothetical protein